MTTRTGRKVNQLRPIIFPYTCEDCNETTVIRDVMDSLDLIECIMSVEDTFDIEIPDDEAHEWVTMGDMLTTITKYKNL